VNPSRVMERWLMDWKSRPLTEIDDGYKLPVVGGVPESLIAMGFVLEKLKVSAHPLASQFLTSVERWVEQESLGADGAKEFAEMRATAMRMISGAKSC